MPLRHMLLIPAKVKCVNNITPTKNHITSLLANLCTFVAEALT